MKQIIGILVLMLLTIYSANTQSIEGSYWEYKYINDIDAGIEYEIKYWVEGDTMIMGERYWEVYTDNEFKNETEEYFGGIRIEGESTLFVPRKESLPLMNTGKRIGERFKKYSGEEEYEVELI